MFNDNSYGRRRTLREHYSSICPGVDEVDEVHVKTLVVDTLWNDVILVFRD